MEMRVEGLARRRIRAVSWIALALVAIVVASVAYIQPSLAGLRKAAGLRPALVTTPGPPLLPDTYAAAYGFISASTGWALISAQTNTPRFWVFQTTDGARHWHAQFTALGPPGGSRGSLQVRFFDAAHGLINVGDLAMIFRTSDGGRNWSQMKIPDYRSGSLDFSDPQHGWVIGYASAPAQPFPLLFSTADGGDTWTPLPRPPTFPIGGKGFGFSPNLAFRSPSEGWLGGFGAPGRPSVFSSIDGGLTWQPHPLPVAGPGAQPNGKGFAPEALVYLVPGTGVLAVTADANGSSVGFTSFDGGSTWRRLPPPPGETTFGDFVFQETFRWWAMRYGTLFKSTDAGQSWKETTQILDEWDYVPQVIDAKHAWAQMLVVFPAANPPRGTGLAFTSDGGLHWTPATPPKPV